VAQVVRHHLLAQDQTAIIHLFLVPQRLLAVVVVVHIHLALPLEDQGVAQAMVHLIQVQVEQAVKEMLEEIPQLVHRAVAVDREV
jgi:hypothetical protein